jgi:peptide/nickel transport system permease protein
MGVTTLIFILFNVIPGDPARMALGQRSDSASVAAVRKDLGLDKPLIVQYLKYIDDLSPISIYNSGNKNSFFFYDRSIYKNSVELFKTGESHKLIIKAPYLRRSYQNQRDISEILVSALPATFYLALISIIFASILGIVIGVAAALKKDTWIDRTLLVLTSFGMSLPSFFAAILIAWLFAYVLGHYTGLELTGSLYEIDDYGEGRYLMLKNIILPSLTLGIRPLSVVTQLTRNTMLDVLSQDFIRTARAKGLSEKMVVWKHALRNALNPVITSISGWFASMMAGVIFIEYIFGWKGLGYVMVNALQSFDMPVVMGAVLLISVIFVVVNIVTDITYTLLDPRIRLG